MDKWAPLILIIIYLLLIFGSWFVLFYFYKKKANKEIKMTPEQENEYRQYLINRFLDNSSIEANMF